MQLQVNNSNNKNSDDEFRIQINCNYKMSVNFSAVGNWQKLFIWINVICYVL